MGDINENEGDTVEEEGADNTLMTTDITVNNQRGSLADCPKPYVQRPRCHVLSCLYGVKFRSEMDDHLFSGLAGAQLAPGQSLSNLK